MGISRSMAQAGAGFSGYGAPRGAFGCASSYGAFGGGDGTFLKALGDEVLDFAKSEEGQKTITSLLPSPSPGTPVQGSPGGMGITIGGQSPEEFAATAPTVAPSSSQGTVMTRGTSRVGQSPAMVNKNQVNEAYGPQSAGMSAGTKGALMLGAAAVVAVIIAKQAKLF